MLRKLLITTVIVGTSIFSGCVAPQKIQTGGVYKQDAFLYNIDNNIVVSYNTLDAFLNWELQNNTYIKSNLPGVFNAANDIRAKAPSVILIVATTRQAYVLASGNTNVTAFVTASNSLQNAVGQLLDLANQATTNVSTVNITLPANIILPASNTPTQTTTNL